MAGDCAAQLIVTEFGPGAGTAGTRPNDRRICQYRHAFGKTTELTIIGVGVTGTAGNLIAQRPAVKGIATDAPILRPSTILCMKLLVACSEAENDETAALMSLPAVNVGSTLSTPVWVTAESGLY